MDLWDKKKIEKIEKNGSNQNFQIAISKTWKGFQTPSKGLLGKNYLYFWAQQQFLKIFKIWALQVKFSEKNAFFGGFLCCAFLTDHIFGIPWWWEKNVILFIFSFLDQKNTPPLLSYCVVGVSEFSECVDFKTVLDLQNWPKFVGEKDQIILWQVKVDRLY